jgi:5-methylcytosine-specific restriction endonuclease McrA
VLDFRKALKRARMILLNNEYRCCKMCDKKYLNHAFNKDTTPHGCSVKCRELINKACNARYQRSRRYKGKKLYLFRPPTKRTMYKQQQGKCKHCNERMNIEHKGRLKDAEVDHIIPLSKGGLHWDKNVQLLCRDCNNKKSNTLIIRQLKQGSDKVIH